MVFIRRKSKGNTYYYELVENTWEDGKTVQKILKYFPDLESANLYCEKKGIQKFETENVLSPVLETRIIKKLDTLNSLRPLPQTTLKNLKDKFEIDMTYNSNAIEGNKLTLRETFLVVRKGITIGGKSLEEHLEAKNHVDAIRFLYELTDKKRRITEEDILTVHHLVLEKIDLGFAGKYRNQQVYIEGAVHVPPPAREVPKLMQRVIKQLNSNEEKEKAIISASKVHYLITFIHPFIDGNGRVARLLLNLRLMRAGFPPIVLKKTQRKSYYGALEKADDGDFYPITTLIAKDIESALDLYLSTVP